MRSSNTHLMRFSRLLLTLTAIVGAILLVAACGSSNTSDTGAHHTKTVTVTRPQKVPTTTATSSTSTTTPTTSTPSGATVAECKSAGLSPKLIQSQGAAGTLEYVFTLANTTSSTCYTYGWPGIGFLGLNGQATPTIPKRVTRDMLGSVGAPKRVTIAAGAVGSFRMTLSDVVSGDGGGCINASDILITAPNDTQSIKFALDPKIPTCGSATVTPMLPGTTAQQSGT